MNNKKTKRSNLFAGAIKSAIVLTSFIFLQACTSDNVASGVQPSSRIASQQQAQASRPEATQIPATENNTAAPSTNSSALAATQNPASTQNTQLSAQQPAQQTASLAPSPSVKFLPVLGPPQSSVSQLSSAIKRSASANSVTLLSGAQTGAKYQVKGYFSALDDGAGTRFIYIWDVLDAQGRKIHRISGEERTSSRGADPWSAVDSNMINNIVNRTMQDLRGWMNTRA